MLEDAEKLADKMSEDENFKEGNPRETDTITEMSRILARRVTLVIEERLEVCNQLHLRLIARQRPKYGRIVSSIVSSAPL
jgi:hypothetical protein